MIVVWPLVSSEVAVTLRLALVTVAVYELVLLEKLGVSVPVLILSEPKTT